MRGVAGVGMVRHPWPAGRVVITQAAGVRRAALQAITLAANRLNAATCAETIVMVTCGLQPNIAVKTAQALPVATGSYNAPTC